MIKKIVFLNLLLLMNFNNIISMQPSDLENNSSEEENAEQNSAFVALPEEARQYILGKLIDVDKFNDIINKIKNAKDIFELYSLDVITFEKSLIENLKSVLLTSQQLKDSAKYYINKLRNAFQEKEQIFIENIKRQYPYSKDDLDERLKSTLNSAIDIGIQYLEEAVKLIIAGADVNTGSINGNNTALILAAIENRKDIVELLLRYRSIDVNLKNMERLTALMYAVKYGYADIVELLLNHGADITIRNQRGKTALMLAEKRGHKYIADLIKAKMNKEK